MAETRSARRAYEYVKASISIPENKKSPWFGLTLRFLLALLLLIANALIVYVDRDGYRDANGDGLSWVDCLYYSSVTLSTTGYGDISPVTQSARLTNFLLLTPLRFAFIALFVGTTIEVLTNRSKQAFREARWRRTVEKQYVVMGYGVKGRSAVKRLLVNGVSPKAIVVIENTHDFDLDIQESQVVAVYGDARREETLRAAQVDQAKQIIIAVDSDDTAVLITLVARRLNPTANIIVAVREGVHNKTFKQSGANTVITTDESTGHLLADTALSPLAGEVLSDLLDPTEGLEVYQREVAKSDIGKNPSDLASSGDLVVSVIRGGIEHRFAYDEIGQLQAGDQIVSVRKLS